MDKEQSSSAEPPKEVADLVVSIQETKSSISEKINKLEDELSGTFTHAKESVIGQVDDVKKMFDINYQIDKRPWLFFGGAVVAGMLIGRSLGSAVAQKNNPAYSRTGNGISNAGTAGGSFTRQSEPGSDSENALPTILESIGEAVKQEADQVKNVAVATAINAGREISKGFLPRLLSKNVDNVFDNMIKKFS